MTALLTALLAAPLLAPAVQDGQGDGLLLLNDGRIFIDVSLERDAEGGIIVHFEHADVHVPPHLVEDALIPGAPPPEPKTPEEKEKFAEGKVLYQGRWMSIDKRNRELEDRIEERREELLAIEKRQLWRNRHKEETKHFAFETTAPPHVFEMYRDQLEAYFEAFADDWKVRPPRENPRLKVCLYVNEDDFLQIGGVPRGVLGYFRFVDPMELNFFYMRQNPVFTTEVLFHEANHYMQKLLDMDFKMPHFPGEAIAEYYGGAHWDDEEKELTVGLVLPSRLVEVKTDIDGGKWWGLKELITTDGAYEHYTWGWTLVHFLMNDRSHKDDFQDFVMELVEGRKVKRESMSLGAISLRTVRPDEIWRVFCDEFKLKDDEDVAELEAAWHQYVDKVLTVEGIRAKEAAGMKALRGYPRREIRGKRLLTEAVEEGSRNPQVYLALGELHYGDGDADAALEHFQKAVELDPLDAEYRVWLGRALRRTGKEDEGKSQLLLAQEMGVNEPSVRWLLEQEDLDD